MSLVHIAPYILLIHVLLGIISIPARLPATTATPRAGSANQAAAASLPYRTYLPLSFHLFDPTYVNPFGIDIYTYVDQAHGVSHMQAAGAKRVTTALDWGTIEPAEGVRDWSSFDTKVRNAKQAGMEVFVLFMGDPAWAWQPDRSATVPEKRTNFVRAMVQRYDCDGSQDAPGGLCVSQWSFYAEPDFYVDYYQDDPGIKGYWGKRGVEYARMLADVANVIHAEDPGARVMIGGLAYDSFLQPGGTRGFVREFLPTVLAELNRAPYAGATRYIDAMAVHYYSLSYPSILNKLHEIRSIMQAHGVAHLPIVVPETGYWSQGDSNENQHAQRLVQIFVEGLAFGVEHLSYYTVFDAGGGTESSGLFRGQDLNSPKPAYFAYRTLTRELTGAKYRQPLGQAGVEGYIFTSPKSTDKTVVWTKQTSATATFTLRCARVVDKLGTADLRINDGAAGDLDGSINGQVAIRVTQNEPIYVEACP